MSWESFRSTRIKTITAPLPLHKKYSFFFSLFCHFCWRKTFLRNLRENLPSFLLSSKYPYKKAVPCAPSLQYAHAHFLQLLKESYVKKISMFLSCSIAVIEHNCFQEKINLANSLGWIRGYLEHSVKNWWRGLSGFKAFTVAFGT